MGGWRSIASAKIHTYFAHFTHDLGDQKMKKIILSLAFIAASFSTLTSAETLTTANGADSVQCTALAAPVTYVGASANGGLLQITIGGNTCWVNGLSDTRLAMAAAMLTEARTSGKNAFVGLVNTNNIYIALY